MGDGRYLISKVVLDASPLIYLAKLAAIDVLAAATEEALVTPTVLEEVARPQLAYRHPDAIEIEQAITGGLIRVEALTDAEKARAADFAARVPGLHFGEAEVLALAVSRSVAAVIFERQARRVARSLGAELVDLVELLVAGTPKDELREDRIVRFARLVNMRFDDVAQLLARLRSRRVT
jgi:predicted nucleic acid-binding protein